MTQNNNIMIQWQGYICLSILFIIMTALALFIPPVTKDWYFIGGVFNTIAIIFFYKVRRILNDTN